MSTETKVDDMEKMLPAQTSVNIKGESININYIKVGKLSAVVAILQPMAKYLPTPGDTQRSNPIDVMSLVMNHTDDAVKLVALLTGKTDDWVKDLDIDELVLLLTAVVEVNLDFFIRRVLPSVSKAMEQLGGSLLGVVKTGQSPSSV